MDTFKLQLVVAFLLIALFLASCMSAAVDQDNEDGEATIQKHPVRISDRRL